MKSRAPLLILTALILAACGPNPPAPQTQSDGVLTPQAADTPDPTVAPGTKAGAQPETIKPIPDLPGAADVERQKLPKLGPKWTSPKGKKPRKQTATLGATSSGITPMAIGGNPSVVGMKILVLYAGKGDASIDAARAFLSQMGVPFDAVDATTTLVDENTLTTTDGSGVYQGVLLTTDSLAWQDPATGQWGSALASTEWSTLWNYERTYKVRQAAMYAFPGSFPEDYGIRSTGASGDANTAVLTGAGQSVFPDLKVGGSIPVQYAWNYPATTTPVAGVTTTPVLNDASGNLLGVLSTSSDGRERLALTMAHNPYLLHSQLFAYGLVNWLTQGVYIGEFRRALQVDIDDWFLDDDLWNATTGGLDGSTYRMSAADALGARDQQTALRTKYSGVAGAFTYAIVFNSGGAGVNATNTCSPTSGTGDRLSSVSKCIANSFDWVNHTRDHESMDCIDYATAYTQWNANFNRARTMGLPVSAGTGVSGEHSGLGWYNTQCLDYDKTDNGLMMSNQNFLKAAWASGVRYLASNRGVASHWDASCPNCGLLHPLNSQLGQDFFLIPRWPTNIFYYASNPAQVVSSYNKMYGPGGVTPYFTTNQTYAQILKNETDIAMNHVLSGSAFPHYMHQTNFSKYDTRLNKSLATDWVDSVLARYSTFSTLPLRTLKWSDLAAYLRERTMFVKANGSGNAASAATLSGTWNRATNTITLKSSGAAVNAFVTGTRGGVSTDTYGPTLISKVPVGAGATVTLSVQK
ncbi:hypothetical protein [Deinococcus pimensis]|uniref:Agd3-related carbohydrate-binding protein n=1 Tax=Deinococcus pimensis TaxID=309888 RepID=UPI0004814D83|nr:hypothetical protein [Deinococcus pimensis]